MSRYGIAEWYGEPFTAMVPVRRKELASIALTASGTAPRCPFQPGDQPCNPPFPDSVRRPDWRSSSAKRLMPQLQIKVPTLRRWGKKLAVAVDQAFFGAIGGPSEPPIQDLDEGEVIWLVPKLSAQYRLQRYHWEMLSLDESSEKLQAARTVRRTEFETTLRSKLSPL